MRSFDSSFFNFHSETPQKCLVVEASLQRSSPSLSLVHLCQRACTHIFLPLSCIAKEVVVTVFSEAGSPRGGEK